MWTKTWPVKEGWYWFYGWASAMNRAEHPIPELMPVKVAQTSTGCIYIAGARFLYRQEGAQGFWTPALCPILPDFAD